MAGNDDLDWLYGQERRNRRSGAGRPEPEGTKVFSAQERAEIERRARAAGETSRGSSGGGSGSAPPARPVRPAPPPPPPPDHRGPRRRRAHGGRRFVGVLLLLVAALVAYLVVVPLIAWSNVENVDDQPPGQRPADTPGETYLLVGSDSREGLTAEQRRRLGTGEAEGQRTDTMMVLYVPPEGRPALVSIPRDSYVEIPGHGKNKINAAYSFGGPELLTQTVEQATGLRMDHYVEIGFGGFVNIIDAIGGIEMCIPKDIQDKNSHLDLKKGCQTLDGPTALGYVRMRYADPEGDLGRVKRQREMVSAVAKKLARVETVLNPVRYWELNHAVAGALGLGQDTGIGDMPRLALAMRDVGKPGSLTLTVPIAGNISTPAGASLAWDEEKASELFGTIASGTTEGLEKFTKS